MGLMGIVGARAQFGDYGVRGALGVATISDDLATKSPIMGFNVGGYINYTFAKSKSVLAEIFYLQTGLNITRRGRSHEEIFEYRNKMHHREGFSHYFAVQLPLLAGVHLEIPVRQPGHVVGVFLGPAVSYGIMGRYNDRMVSPGNPDARLNYDLSVDGSDSQRDVFGHINRLDVSGILGVSYEYGPYTLTMFVDHGFITVSKDLDIIRIVENANATSANKVDEKIPTGNNTAFMLSLSYRLGSFSKE